jgi:hypothetical protein
MKKALLILLFTTCYCCFYHANAQSPSSEIKKLLLGKWVLANDKNFIMNIKEDSIIYCYKRKETDRKPVTFSFGDSLLNFKTKSNAFNFLRNGKLYPKIVLKEYDVLEKDTSDITIVYIDKTGMDLIGGGRTVTFKKVK